MADAERKEYVLYKGDEVVGIGTAKELSEIIGCRPETIRWYASGACHRRDNGKRYVAERV